MTEFERLPGDVADSRGDNASEVVTVMRFTSPEASDGAADQLTLALNRSAVEASDANVTRLRMERYDAVTGEWETLAKPVDESNEGTVTLTGAPPRLGWFVVAAGNSSRADHAVRPANETNGTAPGSDESPNGTPTDSAGAGDASADGSDDAADETDATANGSGTMGSSSTEGDGITQSEVPGFGVTNVLAALALLYGVLRIGRRGR
ncbi:hypothetical protein DJ82_12775 [Halorubrum sp. Ib24]|uniref:hypothetical protein n=1 Tax=Halorubrum sp. Ib24 TaxID=1383850 RepID=UPI000B97ED79|nr:hypothetical protein [Halorubrum sp. Ib24]OYR38142.1 hypothetical protein DJ82_12775 [Halorubrum sp. Ib24]